MLPISEDALKRAADRDFLFLILATILVAVGVLCEAGDVFHELRKWWKAQGRRRTWIPVLSMIGLLLVSVGVILEGLYEAKLGIADTKIRKIDEDRAQDAEKRAQDAKTAAGEAQASAVAASAAAGDARASADSALNDLSRLRGEAGARRLTSSQKEQLRKELATIPTPIGVGFNPMDSEARDFAGDFLEVLNNAKWQAKPIMWIPNGRRGLFLGCTEIEGQNAPQFKLLKKALQDIGSPVDSLRLSVGDSSLSPVAQSHVLYLLIGDHPAVRSTLMHTEEAKEPVK